MQIYGNTPLMRPILLLYSLTEGPLADKPGTKFNAQRNAACWNIAAQRSFRLGMWEKIWRLPSAAPTHRAKDRHPRLMTGQAKNQTMTTLRTNARKASVGTIRS